MVRASEGRWEVNDLVNMATAEKLATAPMRRRLSACQPWAFAIIHGQKRIENRIVADQLPGAARDSRQQQPQGFPRDTPEPLAEDRP